eukprot:gene15901-biopygen14295
MSNSSPGKPGRGIMVKDGRKMGKDGDMGIWNKMGMGWGGCAKPKLNLEAPLFWDVVPGRNGNGRGPDAGYTIELKKTDADRTRAWLFSPRPPQWPLSRGECQGCSGAPSLTTTTHGCAVVPDLRTPPPPTLEARPDPEMVHVYTWPRTLAVGSNTPALARAEKQRGLTPKVQQ